MLLTPEKLAKALAFIEKMAQGVDPEHSDGLEHWDWGNFDDSYEYGYDSGQQALYREAAALWEELKA